MRISVLKKKTDIKRYVFKIYRLESRIIIATRNPEKIPEERIPKCLSGARDWHTTFKEGAHKVLLFFRTAPRIRECVCVYTCCGTPVCARGTVVDPKWCHLASRGAQANPRKHMDVLCCVVCDYLLHYNTSLLRSPRT